MTCKLDKFKTYDVGQVHHNVSTGVYSVKLLNPPAACPDGTFNSKKADLVVNAGSSPSLGYNVDTNRPIITVPAKAYAIDYGSSFGFGDFLLVVGGAAIAFFVARAVYRRLTAAGAEYNAEPAFSGSTYPASHTSPYRNAPAQSVASSAPAAPSGGTTVINNSSGPDVLTTVLLAEALSSHNNGGNTVNNTYVDNSRSESYSNSSDSSDDSFSSSSSSSDDSFSSDSDSSDDSYSSDSSSDDSYSSNSSSDSSFSSDSSDSGSSFGSDS